MHRLKFYIVVLLVLYNTMTNGQVAATKLQRNDAGYFEKRGLNVLVFNRHYSLFGDEKLSGIEIIHHEVRTATNGAVRLNSTPEQWDSIPQFIKREVIKSNNSIEALNDLLNSKDK